MNAKILYIIALLFTPLSVVAQDNKCDSLLLNIAQPYYNCSSAVENMAGVSVSNYSSMGEGNKLLIRGQSSLHNSQPLYVVDGVICLDVQFINTLQISKIEVLSNGYSTAKYGIRGGNGVVEITTKSPELLKSTTSQYRGEVGFKRVLNSPQMATTAQYSTALKESLNPITTNLLRSTIKQFGGDSLNLIPATQKSWFDELLTPALIQNHYIEVASPLKGGGYSLSLHYYNEDDIISVSSGSLTRIGGQFKGIFTPFQNIKVGINLFINYNNTISAKSPWIAAFTTPLIIPHYDKNRADSVAYPVKYASPSQIGLPNEFLNPLALAHFTSTDKDLLNVIPAITLTADIIENKLRLVSSYSENLESNKSATFTKEHSVGAVQYRDENTLYKRFDLFRNSLFSGQLHYTPLSWNQHLDFVAGAELRSERWHNIYGSGSGGMGNNKEEQYITQSDSNERIVSDDGLAYNALSYYFSALYSYYNRYFLTAALRVDGTSKFAKRWGYFPSVSGTWVITSERFMQKNKTFNNLSINANYGIVGNERGVAYNQSTSLTSGQYLSGVFGRKSYSGYEFLDLSSDLDWEKSSQLEIGIDITMFKNRLSLQSKLYRKITTSLNYTSSLSMGLGDIIADNGSLENKGIEASLNWIDSPHNNFSYFASISLALQKNRVLSLGSLSKQIVDNNFAQTVLQVGSPVNSYWGFIQNGVFQSDNLASVYGVQAGDLSYKDLDKNNTINTNDKTIIGNTLPDGIWNLQLGVRWRRVELSALLHGEWGAEIASAIKCLRNENNFTNYTQEFATNMWSSTNRTNKNPSAAGSLKEWNSSLFSSWFLESGTYLEVKNIAVSYTFTPKWLKREDKQGVLIVSGNALNPFCWYKSSIAPQILRSSNADPYSTASAFTLAIKLMY